MKDEMRRVKRDATPHLTRSGGEYHASLRASAMVIITRVLVAKVSTE